MAPTDATLATGGDGVTDRDRAAAERARVVGHALDDAFRLPGTDFRVGLDPILGLLPVSGDAVALVGSLYVVLQAVRVGLPRRRVVAMLVLVGAEFVVGSIPVLGTVFDAVVKVNRRNTNVIEAHVTAGE